MIRTIRGTIANRFLKTIENLVKTTLQSRINWDQTLYYLNLKNWFIKNNKNHLKQKWLSNPNHKGFENTSNLDTGKRSVIYMIYNTRNKQTYIGETQDLLTRIKTEFRNAKNSTNNKQPKQEHFEIQLGKLGLHNWNYVILLDLGTIKHNDKKIRLTYEKEYIKKFQPKLNIMHTYNKYSFTKCSKINNKRPLIKIRRNKVTQTHDSKDIKEQTTYSLNEILGNQCIVTPVIDKYIKSMKHNHYYELKIIKKGLNVTNWNFVMNNIGTSIIIPKHKGVQLHHIQHRIEKAQ